MAVDSREVPQFTPRGHLGKTKADEPRVGEAGQGQRRAGPDSGRMRRGLSWVQQSVALDKSIRLEEIDDHQKRDGGGKRSLG